jgi:hypothetical protein
LIVAATLVVIGLTVMGLLLARQASDPNGDFGVDFADYRIASLRMLDGRSPYAPEMLSAPVPAQGFDRYRYPPPFAQLLTPIAVLPSGQAATAWLAVQAILFFASAWIAGSAARARASLARLLWTALTVTYFFPVVDSLWKGNVEAPIALAVAVMLADPGVGLAGRSRAEALRGALAALGTVLKLVLVAALPAALRARTPPFRWGVGIAMGVTVVGSAILAPQAWADYARVLPNLLAGNARYSTNLAPAIEALNLGAPAAVADVIRVAAIVAGLGLVVLSILLAGRARGVAAAVGCGLAAALLLPAAIWYHYLALFLPLAIFAWVRAPRVGRLVLLASGALVDVGVLFLPLATLAGALLAAVSVVLSWPRASVLPQTVSGSS